MQNKHSLPENKSMSESDEEGRAQNVIKAD